MRDVIFYILIVDALGFLHASALAWSIIAIGIIYAIAATTYARHKGGM